MSHPPINIFEFKQLFKANSTLGSAQIQEINKKLFQEIFSRFKEVYPNFDKVYDKELNFLNITDISSIEKKAELTLEMQNLLQPILEKKISNSTEKPGIIRYILEATGQLFKNILLSPDTKEDTLFKSLKTQFPKMSKNWNWLLQYKQVKSSNLMAMNTFKSILY